MAKDKPAAEADAPKKKGKKLILIAGVLVLALGGGGAGAWYFMRAPQSDEPKAAEAEKPAQFLPLESFTVNLVSPEGQPQYLQAGLTLKLKHDAKLEAIKDRMPEIRNRMLLILSGKKAADLLPVSGKQQLAAELSSTVREVMGESPESKAAAKKAAKAKAKAEAEAAAEGEEEAADKDADPAAAEAKAEKKKKKAKPVVEVAKSEIEVLFTSFIIQ